MRRACGLRAARRRLVRARGPQLFRPGRPTHALPPVDARGRLPARRAPHGPVEGYRTISVGWANASNTPYRKFKSTDYEGGVATPFIAYWPGVIEPGVTEQVGHIIDITATFMDITGAAYPAEIQGRATKPIAGKSLLPVFQGKTREPHSALYWQFGSAKAVRQGDWKLVRFGKAAWELYDMKADRTELNNVAGKHPKKAEELRKLWEGWASTHKGR